MADQDDEGDDYVEGFNAQGKTLDRLTTHKQLHELLKEVTEKKVAIENEVAREQDEEQKKTNQLSKINDEYLKLKATLKSIQQNQKFVLNNDLKREVIGTMQGTLDLFLEKRPADFDAERAVHVYFLAGEETLGSDLAIWEGAGSRDATFLVRLSQTVESLANQAAKYWGLDPKKVFFLDHQGRIVPGNMHLYNIILPPPPDKKTDDTAEGAPQALNSSALAAGASGGGVSDRAGLQLEGARGGAMVPATEESAMDSGYTLKGRDYVLTLVRAKTVLDKEDLSLPKGEAWDDFTFDAAALNKDLEQTRLKRGDEDVNTAQMGLDAIPSLYDLVKEGKKRKVLKRKDMMCRLVEFSLFITVFGFFQYILAPESSWTYTMYLIGKNVRHNMTAFTLDEKATLGVDSFDHISTKEQYDAWLMGPLYRAVFPGGIDQFNTHVLVVQGRTYRNAEKLELDMNWCPEPVIDVPMENTTTTTNTETTTSTTTTTTSTTTTTTTGTTTNGTDALSAGSGTCIPYTLKYCQTENVVKLLKRGIDMGQVVPGCEAIWKQMTIETWAESLTSLDAFSHVNGEVFTYLGGRKTDFNFTEFNAWNDSATEFLTNIDPRPPPAKLLNVFVYQPSVEGLLVIQFLAEFTASGPIVTNVRERSLNFLNAGTAEWVCYGVCIFFSFLVLSMEMQRLLRWPESLVFTDKNEPTRCSSWMVLFVIMPPLLIFSLALRIHRSSLELDIDKLQSNVMINEDPDAGSSLPAFLAKSQPHSWTESMKAMYEIQYMMQLDGFSLLVNLVNFCCMVSLFFRFLLMYFPYFQYLTNMVQRVLKPLLVVLIILCVAFGMFGVVFYVALSDQIFNFRNGLSVTMSTIQFAHGGVVDWPSWYREHGWTFVIAMWSGFFVFTLNLNHLAVAILVSHKKEAELRRNYSSHPFWQLIHRQKYGRCRELNPALVGYDFTGKEPKEVKDWPGAK